MRDRQNLVVLTKGSVTGIVFSGTGKNGVWTTHVRKGELLVFSRRGHIVARFAKGQWSYTFAQDQIVQR